MATAAPVHSVAAHNLSRSSRAEAAGLERTTLSTFEVPHGDAVAKLNFYAAPEDGSVPFNYVEQPPAGQPQHNYGTYTTDVRVKDIRGHESEYDLDRDAFTVISNVPESSEREFLSDESIKKNYYPELEQLLLANVPGSTRVVLFDHTIRRADPNAPRNPVMRVHIDQTLKSATERVVRHLGEDAEKLLQGRYRIINVWRPLNGPVASLPLAFAASHTLDAEDVIPVEHRYPTFTGETAAIQYNERQDWHYLSGMKNNERLLLECFDSEALKPDSKVRGGRVPHTAFEHPRTPVGAPGRESIEVRAIVFGP